MAWKFWCRSSGNEPREAVLIPFPKMWHCKNDLENKLFHWEKGPTRQPNFRNEMWGELPAGLILCKIDRSEWHVYSSTASWYPWPHELVGSASHSNNHGNACRVSFVWIATGLTARTHSTSTHVDPYSGGGDDMVGPTCHPWSWRRHSVYACR